MVDESPTRSRLRSELIRVRDLAGISARGMARTLGLNRGVVQRFDTGRGMLPLDRIEAWLDVCAVVGADRDRILGIAERATGETRPWRDLLERVGHLQADGRERESEAVAVVSFQPTVWPGLLQTPEYARLVLSAGHTTDVDGAVAARIARQQVLFEGATRFSWVLTEHVLRADLGRPDVLAAQLDRARSLARLDTVSIAVLPDSVPLLPWHNFLIWTPAEGDPYVTAELVHGSQEVHGREDVAEYRALWEKLERHARPFV
ncbi:MULTISPECIES: DUF5753 domain-containing protein [Pseudonocardia]|uniref:DUF5753 domain-containing protein n=2 Tax=Pseudonocardia TaxID=1847 RepID=A0A1Y2N846_PSEAH|nr:MULTISPECIES: DUF5753 domain-containing protein [Pseudonocardia]OSY43640.1 hypothetical protein BG845_00586 [Pseudonocardia autotrophica]TDN73370.1 hypothetical protein C8E95_2463 [Pseudonocardia autotrophica]BBG04108.1 transcriptional regulator [Pseudonocardia autotrophica]GEC26245.1 transcriptional regulator [Pseudonocardia saturnea]